MKESDYLINLGSRFKKLKLNNSKIELYNYKIISIGKNSISKRFKVFWINHCDENLIIRIRLK